MCSLLQELHQLEKGITMDMDNEMGWVITSIELVTADMLQENDLCDVKKQDALYECQNCLVSKDRLTDNTFDRICSARFYHVTNEHFVQLQMLIDQHATKTKINNCTQYCSL